MGKGKNGRCVLPASTALDARLLAASDAPPGSAADTAEVRTGGILYPGLVDPDSGYFPVAAWTPDLEAAVEELEEVLLEGEALCYPVRTYPSDEAEPVVAILLSRSEAGRVVSLLGAELEFKDLDQADYDPAERQLRVGRLSSDQEKFSRLGVRIVEAAGLRSPRDFTSKRSASGRPLDRRHQMPDGGTPVCGLTLTPEGVGRLATALRVPDSSGLSDLII